MSEDICVGIGQHIVWHERGKKFEGEVVAKWGLPLRVMVRLGAGQFLTLMASDLKGDTGTIVATVDVPRAVEIAKATLMGTNMRLPLNEVINELARAVLHLAEPQPNLGKEAA